MTRFLHIARGSAVGLENQLLLAKDLDYVAAGKCVAFVKEADEIQRMFTVLIQEVQPIKQVKRGENGALSGRV